MKNLKYIINFKILKIILMGYLNLNQTPSKILKYLNGLEILDLKIPKSE